MNGRWLRLTMIGLGMCLLSLPGRVFAQQEYKTYRPASTKVEYFQLVVSRDRCEVIVPEFSETPGGRFAFNLDQIVMSERQVFIGEQRLFDSDGLWFEDRLYPFDAITDSRITELGDKVIFSFFSRTARTKRVERIRAGNIILPMQDVRVLSGDFVRGMVFTITGNVIVEGEVNKDVISLFGRVDVGSSAVVRGDIATIDGNIDVAREASIYGELYSVAEGRIRVQRLRRLYERFDILDQIRYDRVDGLGLYAGLKHFDVDSVLPTVYVRLGYGFASERWRYEVGLDQPVLRQPALTIGGSYYRRLVDDDGELISDDENTAFALIANEDFRDYYEAEGGQAFARFKPGKNLIFSAAYRYEETGLLGAHPKLWSLFGAKDFRENYSTIPAPRREAGADELDTTSNAELLWRADWDTRDTEDPFQHSAWFVTADFDWSSPDLGSDFDYRRYQFRVRRYQEVSEYSMLLIRAVYGGSDGYLPLSRRYFLGGLGTMRGYRHKEYVGTRYWLGNMEYRIALSRWPAAFSVLWDVGQIADGTGFGSDVEIRHSLGAALYVGEHVRVSLAKRLDRSTDDNPRIYVRLVHRF